MSSDPANTELKPPIWEIKLRPTRKLLLFALADWANGASGSVNPAMSAIAQRVSISRSQAQRIVHELIDTGLISVTGNHNGGAPGTTRQYRLNIDRIRELAAGRTHAQKGSHGRIRRAAQMPRAQRPVIGRQESTSEEQTASAVEAPDRADCRELNQLVIAYRAPGGEYDWNLVERLEKVLGVDSERRETWGDVKAQIQLRLAERGLG